MITQYAFEFIICKIIVTHFRVFTVKITKMNTKFQNDKSYKLKQLYKNQLCNNNKKKMLMNLFEHFSILLFGIVGITITDKTNSEIKTHYYYYYYCKINTFINPW